MVRLVFRQNDGTRREVEAREGESVMLAAVRNKVVGIEALCGGSQVCGTCHAYFAEPWYSGLPEKTDDESEILRYGALVQPNSRLCCQVSVSAALEGAEVSVPASQL